MDKPVQPKPVVVTLRPEDAFDLGERVARGEFSSLDEAVAAELADLNYRRAVEIMGGGDKLEALVTRLEAENVGGCRRRRFLRRTPRRSEAAPGCVTRVKRRLVISQ
jgi:Arc/MetJ-type ribon-helix-helix transcriptional regulator